MGQSLYAPGHIDPEANIFMKVSTMPREFPEILSGYLGPCNVPIMRLSHELLWRIPITHRQHSKEDTSNTGSSQSIVGWTKHLKCGPSKLC
uniref:Uncharacterized protein n=1 Tax=Aegilops tauschii subsp. strangulata TaxID=200361 RepID=A0A453ST05_AEGTS